MSAPFALVAVELYEGGTIRMKRVINARIDQVVEFSIGDCADASQLAEVIEDFRINGVPTFDIDGNEFDEVTG